ncbi:MAG: segregation/condensation protein A, partial [Myxococcales bacterium]|nr:segregation/condensation protein A [Myxococcales bacterium]
MIQGLVDGSILVLELTMSADPPHPIDPNFQILLPNFEGPLDLLLHLIRIHELEILDLPIAFITDRYLEYISMMEVMNLEVAAEYLVMAATLAHIKSKSLLPSVPEDQQDEEAEEVDPREELIRRLLEYQKYKRAAEQMGGRSVVGRDVFPRGIPAPQAEGPAPLAAMGVFTLLEAFQAILKRAQASQAFEISAERITIQARMGQITELLRLRRRCVFEELFEDVNSTYDVVVTFLA